MQWLLSSSEKCFCAFGHLLKTISRLIQGRRLTRFFNRQISRIANGYICIFLTHLIVSKKVRSSRWQRFADTLLYVQLSPLFQENSIYFNSHYGTCFLSFVFPFTRQDIAGCETPNCLAKEICVVPFL
ncbi:hypothetical protein LCGC14_0220130 [marine sediment metagenome]|uniref:Uncharacterized protein n=1 Tax=marine sediment metagenome TaxID=412755 RepID=A0A0F9XGV4_9ZZZZ